MLDTKYKTKQKFNLLPKWKFYVIFPNIVDFLSISEDEFIQYNGLDPNISNYVKSVDIPHYNLGEGEEIKVGPHKIKTTGEITVEDLIIDFYAEDLNNVLAWYEGWNSLKIDTKSGLKNPRSSYEKEIKIYLYDSLIDMNDIKNGELGNFRIGYEFYGCYPVKIDNTKVDYNDDEFIEGYSITFAINNGMKKILNNINTISGF